METVVRSFRLRPLYEHSMRSHVIWLSAAGAFLIWDLSDDGSTNAFVAALALGGLLALLLRLGRGPSAWRIRSFALPPLLVLLVAVPFESRLWLVPFYVALILMFTAFIVLPSDKVVLTRTGIRLRTLWRRWNIPYSNVASFADPTSFHPHARLLLREPARTLLGEIREVSFAIAAEDVAEFRREIESRITEPV